MQVKAARLVTQIASQNKKWVSTTDCKSKQEVGQHRRLQVKAGVGHNHRLQVKAGVGQRHRLQVKAAFLYACKASGIISVVAVSLYVHTLLYVSLSIQNTCPYLKPIHVTIYISMFVSLYLNFTSRQKTQQSMETRNYLFMLAQITAIHLLKTNFHTPPQIGESKPLIFCHRIVPQSGLTFYPTTSELVAQKPKFQICGSSLQHSNGRSHNLCKRLVACHDQTFGGSDWNPIFSENILQIF